MRKSRFQNHWMQRPDFVDWLRRDSKDVFRAYCNVCQQSFDVKNMGEGAVKSHAGSRKHIANLKNLDLCRPSHHHQREKWKTNVQQFQVI